MNKIKHNSFKDYLYAVADYIDLEYGHIQKDYDLTKDEKYAIKLIVTAHFEISDSVNNAANDVINYVRQNRKWMKDLL